MRTAEKEKGGIRERNGGIKTSEGKNWPQSELCYVPKGRKKGIIPSLNGQATLLPPTVRAHTLTTHTQAEQAHLFSLTGLFVL